MSRVDTFATAPDGARIDRVTLERDGLRAGLLTWGATLQDLRLAGLDHPLVAGSDSIAPYLDSALAVAGAVCAPVANRISGARFTLDGARHTLDANFLGTHCLHGGRTGAATRNWALEGASSDTARFRLDLAHGEGGFPGNRTLLAVYRLGPGATFTCEITVTTDAPTLSNPAFHPYFDLGGTGDGRDHALRIAAEAYLPADEELIPTGEVVPVDGTAFDFRALRPVGRHPYDTCFCLSERRTALRDVAELVSHDGRVSMQIATTEPGLQVYDARHFPEAGMPGHDGRILRRYGGLALETQRWPDAPANPHFPSIVLRPGETDHQETRYRFRGPQDPLSEGPAAVPVIP